MHSVGLQEIGDNSAFICDRRHDASLQRASFGKAIREVFGARGYGM